MKMAGVGNRITLKKALIARTANRCPETRSEPSSHYSGCVRNNATRSLTVLHFHWTHQSPKTVVLWQNFKISGSKLWPRFSNVDTRRVSRRQVSLCVTWIRLPAVCGVGRGTQRSKPCVTYLVTRQADRVWWMDEQEWFRPLFGNAFIEREHCENIILIARIDSRWWVVGECRQVWEREKGKNLYSVLFLFFFSLSSFKKK